MSEADKRARQASLIVGVPLGTLMAIVTGGLVSRFVFGERFFDPVVVVTCCVVVPLTLILINRRSQAKERARLRSAAGDDDD